MFKKIWMSSAIAVCFAGAAAADGHMAAEQGTVIKESSSKSVLTNLQAGQMVAYIPLAAAVVGILVLGGSDSPANPTDGTNGTDGTDGTGGTNGTSGS